MRANSESSALIDVFSSPEHAVCGDRAFMLIAVNIPSQMSITPEGCVLSVAHDLAELARHHLALYERELTPAPVPPVVTAPRYPHAWLGSVTYMAVLILVALATVRGWWGPDTFLRGALDTEAIRAGQWWRAVTALTLHLDIVHLVSNLGAGAVIGWAAARQLGVGHAWLLTVFAAVASNLLEGLIGAADHRSVGASTAVFAALGLVTAHVWRRGGAGAQSWARRAGPLVAGVVLLGLLGSGGGLPEQGPESAGGTDLVAHALGFVIGAIGGVVVVMPPVAKVLKRVPQWASAAAIAAALLLAWGVALAA
jgi:membrane associated rhomboid family serine protease